MFYKEFEEELESLVQVAKEALDSILLSEDRTSKHPPYSWKNEDINEHIFKAIGHISYGAGQFYKYKKLDGEDHIHNAIVRLLMAKWLIDHSENKVEDFCQCPNCGTIHSYNNSDCLVLWYMLNDHSCFMCSSCGSQFLVYENIKNDDGKLKTERYNP